MSNTGNAPAPYRPVHWMVLLGCIALGAGCPRSAPTRSQPVIATTTSYLEAAVYDLLSQEIPVLRLAEPGTCPGHFDIRPSQVTQLRRCRALLRFDFQEALDTKLRGSGSEGPRVAEIRLGGKGMCHPDTYLLACRQAGAHLADLEFCSQTTVEARVTGIASRLNHLARQTTNSVLAAGLRRAPVIASDRQRDFCEWLGLEVVATFRAADLSSVGEIQAALEAGKVAQVSLVIANQPEGRRTADALAERLGARVAVFENFPALRDGRLSFDDMVRRNLNALVQAGTTAAGAG